MRHIDYTNFLCINLVFYSYHMTSTLCRSLETLCSRTKDTAWHSWGTKLLQRPQPCLHHNDCEPLQGWGSTHDPTKISLAWSSEVRRYLCLDKDQPGLAVARPVRLGLVTLQAVRRLSLTLEARHTTKLKWSWLLGSINGVCFTHLYHTVNCLCI